MGYGPQLNATEVNAALSKIMPNDAFGTVAVTNVDLWPGDDWTGHSCLAKHALNQRREYFLSQGMVRSKMTKTENSLGF